MTNFLLPQTLIQDENDSADPHPSSNQPHHHTLPSAHTIVMIHNVIAVTFFISAFSLLRLLLSANNLSKCTVSSVHFTLLLAKNI